MIQKLICYSNCSKEHLRLSKNGEVIIRMICNVVFKSPLDEDCKTSGSEISGTSKLLVDLYIL